MHVSLNALFSCLPEKSSFYFYILNCFQKISNTWWLGRLLPIWRLFLLRFHEWEENKKTARNVRLGIVLGLCGVRGARVVKQSVSSQVHQVFHNTDPLWTTKHLLSIEIESPLLVLFSWNANEFNGFSVITLNAFILNVISSFLARFD